MLCHSFDFLLSQFMVRELFFIRRISMARSKVICDQEWEAIESQYVSSEPFNYAVIDNVLPSDVCASVREQIVGNWGWQYMNWQAKELYIRDFELREITEVAHAIKESLPDLLHDMELVQYIAFWHQRNAGLYAHSDTGAVTLNLWLTPDEYNLDPTTGGLILYDVKRRDDMLIHEFNAAPYSTDYLAANTKGQSVTIPYRFNRATLFDAKTLHASDQIHFVNDGPNTARINFSLLFDNPIQFKNRFAYANSKRALGGGPIT